MLKSIVNGAEHDIISIPMKGKNLLQEMELGDIDASGHDAPSSNTIRTKGYIEITPENEYTIDVYQKQTSAYMSWRFYDAEKNFVGVASASTIIMIRGSSITNIISDNTTNGCFKVIDERIKYVRFRYTLTSDVNQPIMFMYGNEQQTTYEPYGYQNGWEVRDNQNRLIWGREDELQTTTGTLTFKGYDLPVKVKSLLGSSVQNGTPSPDNPIIPEMCGVRTGNLIDKTEFTGVSATIEQIDNGIRVITESGGYAARIILDVQENTDYTLSYIWKGISGTATNVTIVFAGTDSSTEIARFSNNTGGTFNTGNNTKINIWFYAAFGVKATVEYTDIILNSGSTALPYEPFGWKITFDNNGENLWNKGVPQYVYANDYKKYNPDNAIALKAGTYTISSDGKLPIIQVFDANHTQLNSDSTITYTSGYYTLWDGLAIGPQSGVFHTITITLLSDYILTFAVSDNLGTYLMLNSGSTALPYSPYLNKTTPIYLSEVPTIRRIKKLVLTGEENWGYSSYESKARVYLALDSIAESSSISTHYQLGAIRTYPNLNEYCINSASALVIGVDINNITTADDFKSYLATQYQNGTPVTIWYILANPQTGIVNEPLCKIGDYADEITTIKVHGLSAPLYGIGNYKDILNLSTGVVTRKIKKYEFTGNEKWSIGNYPQSGSYQFFTPKPSGIIANPSSWIITHFKTGATLNGSAFGSYLSLYPEISILPENASANHFKNWLAAQYTNGTPVTIWYILETTETETVTVPTGMTGEIEGYLTQISTPTPTNRSVPKWNGKEETGGTYAVTVYDLPEIPTTTGKNTLTVDTTLAPYNVTIDGHIKYTYWGKIREDVRSGLAQTKFPVGTILYDNEDETTGRAFQVVGYDKHFDPSLTARGYTHSMTLCQLKLSGPWQYDATEAFLYTTVEMQPGTYKFKIPNYDTAYGGNKTYYFTSTATVPVDSQIVLKWDYQKLPASVTAYAGPNPQTNTTPLTGFNALTLTEWVEGESPEAIDLGTIKLANNDPDSAYGKLNHIHRARYGSNNYYQSGLRQLLNTDLASNNWWHPTTIFDRPYANRTTNGYLRSLNEDFINVLATPEITHIANNIFEYPSLDGRTFTKNTEYKINTDKIFLLSHTEVGLSSSPNIGTVLDYYSTHNTNADRIKYRLDNGNAYYWWFRTPYPTNAYDFRRCNASGTLGGGLAYTSLGVAPAHIIQ